jgi:hypothetical protein
MLSLLRVLLLATVIFPLCAQFNSASFSGVIKDATGSVVPDARITVTNINTGLTRTDNAAGDGAFLFPVLPVGTYKVTVEKTGFSTYVQEGITLAVGQAVTQNVTLQIGSTTQQVTVQENAAMVSTQTATVSQVVGQRQIVDLPLNGRAAQSLVFLAPGSYDSTSRYCGYNCQGGVYPSSQEAAVNGGGTANVNYLMDGAGHNDSYINVNLPFPNPDAIQEFSLQTSNMSAEYGDSAAVVNVVTKSGTNAFHGDAFEFLRNGNLNARNFFAPTQDTLKRNQFGGTIGGPVLKDKLFFFGTYQGTRIRSATQGKISFVPTQAERNGDFAATSARLVDPTANNAPFPGNQIPLSRFTAPSNYFLQRLPLPNGPGEQVTYAGPAAKQNDDQFMPKVDWVHGKSQLSGRLFYTKYSQPSDTSQIKQNILAVDGSGNQVRVATVAINHTYSVSPTLLMNSWFGWDSQIGGTLSGIPSGADAITFPAAGVRIAGGGAGIPPAIEALNVTGFFNIQSGHLGEFDRGDWRFREVVTMEKARHELIFGTEVVRLTQDITNTNNQSGAFQFNGRLSGSNLADFLLGTATQFQQAAGQYQDVRGLLTSFFVQDNWRVSQKLVLNLGLRWDPFWPFTEKYNRTSCFIPGQKSQRYPNAPAGLVYGGDPGCPANSGYDAAVPEFAPRFGFAWRLNDKTVVRGGSGLYYATPQTSQNNGNSGVQPFNTQVTLTGVSFVDPYGSGGVVNPFPAAFGGTALPSSNATFVLPAQINGYFPIDFHPAAMATWNLKVERQVGANWLFSAGYIGNSGYHLSSNQYGRRTVNPAIYIPGASTVANTQSRRPYKDFSVLSVVPADFNSSYQSLQLNAEKRFSRGLQLLANYSWSKMIDNFAPPNVGVNANPFNRNLDRGLSNDDVPRIFHFSAVWQIPVPKLQGFAKRALAGWQLSSITNWQSGYPYSVFSGVDNSFSGINRDYADYVGPDSPSLHGLSHAQQVQRFFNTSVFTVNKIGTFGNAGKNILRGPSFCNTDLGLMKDTPIREHTRIQFRAEFFNLFNTVHFGLPGATVGQPSFGKITSAGDPRILQLTMKLLF